MAPTLSGAHAIFQPVAVVLKLLGARIIVGGVLVSLLLFVNAGRRDENWCETYVRCSANSGAAFC